MGYNIEVSINMMKHSNVSEIKREITDFALELNCDHYYYLYEVENINRIPRNHVVIVVNFDDSEIFNCAHFLKTIKKMKNLHIECIYDDEIACNLLYASQYYLTTVEKDKMIKYNKNKRERSLSDNDKTILEPVFNIKLN
uniref:Uncharacterized protein n=1 Tax=viral metagenome TaxID=1070528 RepID=A0A6C0D9B0_9ZZZZ